MNEITKRYNKVLDIINKRLITDDDAKKARGEVFTPLPLVQEMILGLRRSAIQKGEVEIWGLNEQGEYVEDDEEDRVGGVPLDIIRDSETKWLDPANGIGNFPVVAFYLLDFQIGRYGKKEFRGLENRDKRQNHIVQNMLYMIELNKGNVNASIKIFKLIVPDVKPNICCADTLKMTDEKLMEVFGVNRFDVVMGNPPYNAGGIRSRGDRLFYGKFILYGFDLLRKGGCLVFLHPPNFHRIHEYTKQNIKSIFDENNLSFLRIITNSRNYFDVTVSIDYYVLQKGTKKRTTILDDKNVLTDNVDFSKFEVIPNYGLIIIEKMMKLKKELGPFKAKHSRIYTHTSTRLDKESRGPYPMVHTITQTGIRVYYAKNKHEHQNTPKIFVNSLGTSCVFDDTKGKYGSTEMQIVILEPSKKEQIFLFSKLFQYLNSALMLKRNHSDKYVYDVLPDFDKLDFKNEETMMDALGLTEKEKKDISKTKIPIFTLNEKIVTTQDKTKKAFKGGGTRKVRR